MFLASDSPCQEAHLNHGSGILGPLAYAAADFENVVGPSQVSRPVPKQRLGFLRGVVSLAFRCASHRLTSNENKMMIVSSKEQVIRATASLLRLWRNN